MRPLNIQTTSEESLSIQRISVKISGQKQEDEIHFNIKDETGLPLMSASATISIQTAKSLIKRLKSLIYISN